MDLFADQIGAVSIIEMIWMTLAVIGSFFSAINARDAWLDLHALEGATNGRRLLAIGAVRRESLRLVIYLIYLVIGVSAGIERVDADRPLVIATLLLVFTLFVLTLNSIFDRKERRVLLSGIVAAREAAVTVREGAATSREGAATVREDAATVREGAATGREDELGRQEPLAAQMERMADNMDRVEEKADAAEEKAVAAAAAPRAARERAEDKAFGVRRRELEVEHREEEKRNGLA